MQETQSHPRKLVQGPSYNLFCLPNKALMFCVWLWHWHGNEPLCKQPGRDAYDKEDGSSKRPANTRAGSIPPSTTAMSEQPSCTFHWSFKFSFQHYPYQLNTGSLRKTLLRSQNEKGKCVVFVCHKLQWILLSWPPPISLKTEPILASIASTNNELYGANTYCRWLQSHFLHLMSS